MSTANSRAFREGLIENVRKESSLMEVTKYSRLTLVFVVILCDRLNALVDAGFI